MSRLLSLLAAAAALAALAGCGATPDRVVRDVDERYTDICRGIADIVDATDRAFGEPRVEDREQVVRVEVGLSEELRQGRDHDPGLRLRLRLPLPALERKANVFLEFDSGLEALSEWIDDGVDSEDNPTASTSFLTQITDLLAFGTKVGLEWNGGPQAYLRPFTRYERRWEQWRFFGEQQVYWKTDNGFGGKTRGQFDRLLTSTSFLRLQASAEYHEEMDGVNMDVIYLYRKPFLTNSVLSFDAGLDFNTDNYHENGDDVNEAFLRVRWKGKVWRRWLEYELRPTVFFPWEGDRSVEFGALFRLSVIFEEYLRPDKGSYQGKDPVEDLLR